MTTTRFTIKHSVVALGKVGDTPSAQTWFAGGERLDYDPKSRALAVQGAPLKIFLRREGLVWVDEGAAAFTERCRDVETFHRVCGHGR